MRRPKRRRSPRPNSERAAAPRKGAASRSQANCALDGLRLRLSVRLRLRAPSRRASSSHEISVELFPSPAAAPPASPSASASDTSCARPHRIHTRSPLTTAAPPALPHRVSIGSSATTAGSQPRLVQARLLERAAHATHVKAGSAVVRAFCSIQRRWKNAPCPCPAAVSASREVSLRGASLLWPLRGRAPRVAVFQWTSCGARPSSLKRGSSAPSTRSCAQRSPRSGQDCPWPCPCHACPHVA